MKRWLSTTLGKICATIWLFWCAFVTGYFYYYIDKAGKAQPHSVLWWLGMVFIGLWCGTLSMGFVVIGGFWAWQAIANIKTVLSYCGIIALVLIAAPFYIVFAAIYEYALKPMWSALSRIRFALRAKHSDQGFTVRMARALSRAIVNVLKAFMFIAVMPYRFLWFAFLFTDDFAAQVQRLFAARMTGNYEDPYIDRSDRSLGSIFGWGVLGFLGWIGRGLAIGTVVLVLVRVLHAAHVVDFEFIRLGHGSEALFAFVIVCGVSGPALYFGYSVCKVLWRQSRTIPRALVRSKAECSLWMGLATLAIAFGFWFSAWARWWEFEMPPDTRTRTEQLQDEAQEDANNRWNP